MPVVGGHLTIGHAPALSASCTGFARAPLRASAARPGDVLLAAFAIDGRYMSDAQPFFTALHDRDPTPAARPTARRSSRSRSSGLCHAARDISMPGVAGSLLQMIEGAGRGATLDLDALPRPDGAPLERWLLTFPSFGFLLAAPPEHADAGASTRSPPRPRLRGLRAASTTPARCGSPSAARGHRRWDLAGTPLTGLAARSPSAGA